MALSITRFIRRSISRLFLVRGYKHARSINHYIFPDVPTGGRSTREFVVLLQKESPYYRAWRRSFDSDTEPGDYVEGDEIIAQIETDKVTIDVISPEARIIQKFVAKEGDTVVPGTKVAVISKSGPGAAQPLPDKEKSKDIPQPLPVVQEIVDKPKTSEAIVKEKPKIPSPPPPKASPTEPQLPPKDRER